MHQEEDHLRQRGFERIAGIDEAGRGPLAGPVAAAAVIFPADYRQPAINDSKQLTFLEREELFGEITRSAQSYAVIMIHARKIDEMGILNATKLAMRQAALRLNPRPDFILIDALALNVMGIPQKGIVRGDATVFSIAAASILAKVTRDRWMARQHKKHPQYGFDRHMGYPTPEHLEAIAKHGPCPLHRISFSPFRKNSNEGFEEA